MSLFEVFVYSDRHKNEKRRRQACQLPLVKRNSLFTVRQRWAIDIWLIGQAILTHMLIEKKSQGYKQIIDKIKVWFKKDNLVSLSES